jgi:hypothetical protein
VILIRSGTASAIAGTLLTVPIIVGVVIGLTVIGVVGLLVYRVRQDRCVLRSRRCA